MRALLIVCAALAATSDFGPAAHGGCGPTSPPTTSSAPAAVACEPTPGCCLLQYVDSGTVVSGPLPPSGAGPSSPACPPAAVAGQRSLPAELATLEERKFDLTRQLTAQTEAIRGQLLRLDEQIKHTRLEMARQAEVKARCCTPAQCPCCPTLEQKLDAILRKLETIDKRLNTLEKGKAATPVTPPCCSSGSSSTRLSAPGEGPVPIAVDFGFPTPPPARKKDQVFDFWIGYLK
jgi:hypothetical protein